MGLVEKKAIFNDKKGNKCIALIKYDKKLYLFIDVYNENNECIGYLRIWMHPNNRLFLDVIYIYDKYRNLGVASMINFLADYLLEDYKGCVIRGCFDPKQLSTDRENGVKANKEELEINARNFYEKAGYVILQHDDYNFNKSKYPFLINDDFYRGEGGATTIVAKVIPFNQNIFFEENDIIYHKDFSKIKSSNY